MKIKQAAERLQVSQRTIRYYEEKGLVRPGKEDNQYRVFSENDIERLRTVIAFREIGMPLAQIQDVLQELDTGGNETVSVFLEKQRSEMTVQQLKLKQAINTVEKMLGSQSDARHVGLQELHGLATELKEINQLRSDWQDRWHFDNQAERYDEQVYKRGSCFDVHANYDEALETTVHYVNPQTGETGLDIGIGTGNLTAGLLQQNDQITIYGTDQSIEMLKQCNRKFPDVETKLGNFLALPYENTVFDFVVTSYALHHLTDDQKMLALEEMSRVLKQHGRIAIADLMFIDQPDREHFLAELAGLGNETAVHAIEDEFYANRSRLISWFSVNGFRVQHQQINDYLHIIFAEK